MGKQYLAITAFADEQVSQAYDDEAWDAVLTGDLDAALKAKPRLVNTATGQPLAAAEAKRILADQAKKRQPTMSSITAEFWAKYAEKHGDRDER